jgi:hypothetical protein
LPKLLAGSWHLLLNKISFRIDKQDSLLKNFLVAIPGAGRGGGEPYPGDGEYPPLAVQVQDGHRTGEYEVKKIRGISSLYFGPRK